MEAPDWPEALPQAQTGAWCASRNASASKELLEQGAQSACDASERAGPHRSRGFTGVIPMAVHDEPDRSRKRRTVHVIGQSANADRCAAANGEVEDLLGDLGDAFEHGAAAGQHDSRVQ